MKQGAKCWQFIIGMVPHGHRHKLQCGGGGGGLMIIVREARENFCPVAENVMKCTFEECKITILEVLD